MSRRRKNADLELEQEVAAIAKQYTAAKGEETRQKTETAEVSGEAKRHRKKKSTVPQGSCRRSQRRRKLPERKWREKRNTFFSGDRFGQKKSDDPDVIYGRDVEGEPMEIEQITGEIGGVTIRGQVLSFEARELRIAKTLLML